MPPAKNLLPPVQDLIVLSPQKIKLVVEAINLEGERDLRFASLSQVCGLIGLMTALLCFTYLVATGHDTGAAVVLGSTVTGAITKIALSRL